MSHFDIYLKQNKKNVLNFLPFLGISTLPSTQTVKVIGLSFFFFELAMKNWTMNMHFNPLLILRGLFLG